MLTSQQFEAAAAIIGCEVACIQAVYEIETAGRGYLADGRVKILFEGHRFWKQVVNAGADPLDFLHKHPEYSNVLYKKWNKVYYEGGAREWDRMSEAMRACNSMGIKPELALKSASFGSFQIMGENCMPAGYDSAQAMLASYNLGGEAEQLNSFVRFIKATHLDDELRALNFQKFADGYNGSQSRLNRYAPRLFAMYNHFKQGVPVQ